MKKAVLLLLAAMSTGAMAGWVPIDEDESFYVDPSTIQKNGKVAKMWVLLNLDKPDTSLGKPVLSLKTQKEYDCAGERIRDLSMSAHSGKMGGGNVVTSDNGSEPGKWETFRPGSAGETEWRVACGKLVLNERAAAKGRSGAIAAGAERDESAGWLKVTETDTFIGYADQASMRRKGRTVTMWAMYDFKEPLRNRRPSFLARSSKDYFEFDCDRAKWRSLSSTLYAESWGRGKSKGLTQAAGDWAWIAPDSFGESLWKIACGKGALKPDWVRIDSTPDFDYYIEVPAMPRQENTVKMRTMKNYKVAKQAGPASYLSSTSLNEYDCANRRTRILAMAAHSNAMGKGETVIKGSEEESPAWTALTPGSNGEEVWKIACGKIAL